MIPAVHGGRGYALHPAYQEQLHENGIRKLWAHRHHADAGNRRQVRKLIFWTIADLRAHRKVWGPRSAAASIGAAIDYALNKGTRP